MTANVTKNAIEAAQLDREWTEFEDDLESAMTHIFGDKADDEAFKPAVSYFIGRLVGVAEASNGYWDNQLKQRAQKWAEQERRVEENQPVNLEIVDQVWSRFKQAQAGYDLTDHMLKALMKVHMSVLGEPYKPYKPTVAPTDKPEDRKAFMKDYMAKLKAGEKPVTSQAIKEPVEEPEGNTIDDERPF